MEPAVKDVLELLVKGKTLLEAIEIIAPAYGLSFSELQDEVDIQIGLCWPER